MWRANVEIFLKIQSSGILLVSSVNENMCGFLSIWNRLPFKRPSKTSDKVFLSSTHGFTRKVLSKMPLCRRPAGMQHQFSRANMKSHVKCFRYFASFWIVNVFFVHWSRVVLLCWTFPPQHFSLEVCIGQRCSLLTLWHALLFNGAARLHPHQILSTFHWSRSLCFSIRIGNFRKRCLSIYSFFFGKEVCDCLVLLPWRLMLRTVGWMFHITPQITPMIFLVLNFKICLQLSVM